MAKKREIRRVWINLELLFSSQRDILFGISGYAKRNAFWNIVIANGERNADISSIPKSERPDGIITTVPLPPALVDSDIPPVAIGANGAKGAAHRPFGMPWGTLWRG